MKKAVILFVIFLVVSFSFICGYYLYDVPNIQNKQTHAKINTNLKDTTAISKEERNAR